jgi:CDP-glucose 4,6-dehydratase
MSDASYQSASGAMNGTSVLVTGATGFIGSWLTAALALAGARVSAWGREPFRDDSPVALSGLVGLRPLAVDVTDYDAVRRAVASEQPELVVHLASRTSVRQCHDDPRGAFLVNAMGTLNLLEALRTEKVAPRVIVCSSHMASGRTDPAGIHAVDEREPPYSGDAYGTSKAASELIASSYHVSCLSGGYRIAVVRFANVFGFGETHDDRVIPKFVRSAVNRHRIDLAYRLNGRQFVFVTDVVRGLLRVAHQLSLPDADCAKSGATRLPGPVVPPVYHFAIEQYGTEDQAFIRMHDLARLVSTQTGAEVDAERAQDYAPQERQVQCLSCRRTRDELGWEPAVSLIDGIRLLVEWHRARALPEQEGRGTMVRLVSTAMQQVVSCMPPRSTIGISTR